MKAYRHSNVTIQEYISLEEESEIKYEFHNGEVFAMVGGTYNHGLLCGNIYTD